MTAATRELPTVTIIRPATPGVAAPLTPEQELEQFERQTGATLTAQQRRRFFAAQLYRYDDLAKLHEAGAIALAPQGPRVLLRAILQADAVTTTMEGEFGGHALAYDARTCIAHEIVAIGGGVKKHLDDAGIPEDDRPAVGDHVFVLSTVADRASKTDRSVRLWTVHVDDVSLRWRAPG
jgi:hypothetical protein